LDSGLYVYIRLTELIKQHCGVLELYWWLVTKTRFLHETGPEKSSQADIRCTGPQIVLHVFSFRLELRVCQDLVAGRIPQFLHIKNELSQGKFGNHIGAPDAYILKNSIA